MQYSFLKKLAVCGIVTVALTVTSFGGAYASSVLAATPEAAEIAVVEKPDDNAALGGLVALGVIAALVSSKSKKNDSSPNSQATAGVTVAEAKVPSSQPAPVPVVVTKPAQSPIQPTPVIVTKPAPSPAQPPTSQIKAAEQRAFELLNSDRRANGLPALKLNGSLVVLAENYGKDMIKRGYFSHYSPEGQSPFDRMRSYGISYQYAGENLAINSSVEAAERAFMNSPGHRANILNPNYTEVGVGVSYDSRGSVYVVQEFIGR